MKTRVDARLLGEVQLFQLEFSCERCAHFVEESGACVNEYPNAAHREGALTRGPELEFCKEFELA